MIMIGLGLGTWDQKGYVGTFQFFSATIGHRSSSNNDPHEGWLLSCRARKPVPGEANRLRGVVLLQGVLARSLVFLTSIPLSAHCEVLLRRPSTVMRAILRLPLWVHT
jgi:hypothetical protein